MFISDRIRNLAPAQSSYYRLVIQLHDGGTKTFPLDPEAYFRLGTSPFGVPPGKYTICYFDEQRRLLLHNDRSIDINLQGELYRSSQAQLSLHTAGSESPQGSRDSEAGDGRLNRPTQDAAAPQEAQDLNARPKEPSPEFQQYLQAMELEERQQEFIKNSTYVTEIGELFALNRIMRREIVEMQRLIVQHSQQAYKDIEQVMAAQSELVSIEGIFYPKIVRMNKE